MNPFLPVLVMSLAAAGLVRAEKFEPAANVGSLVQPLSTNVLRFQAKGPRASKLMRDYYKSVARWDEILLSRSKPVPNKPDCIYYGDGGHEENDIRPLAYAALVNAFLAETECDGYPLDLARRVKMRSDAMGALRYLAQGHITGSGACLNGKHWGNQWQSAMWARSVVLGGWILWPKLPVDLQAGLARMAEFEADRFLTAKLKSSEFNDTGAEENAWDAHILALACNMMPKHPRASRWAAEAKRWMYNSFSVAADHRDDRSGDDGRPIKDWVQTTNAHPDFTVENHGLVHVGYLKTTLAMLLENSLPYLLTGAQVPRACHHHTSDAFNVLCRTMGWDGVPVYFSGNDWKITHTHGNDVASYGLLSVLETNRTAAYLETLALDYIPQLQKVEGGFYNCRRDLESGGLSATRMIAACWAHALRGDGADPITKAEFERQIDGVTLFENGKVLLHRTPTEFVSFSWGQKRMALSYPENGSYLLWPHFDSYMGQINGVDSSIKHSQLTHLKYAVRRDGFDVSGLLQRGKVQQAVWFSSLPNGVTIYIERLQCAEGAKMKSRETGIIGLEYELESNERILTGKHGVTKAVAVGGEQAAVVPMATDWLNISDRVGYVVRRGANCANVMRYHDQPRGAGRTPQLQEWISLIGEKVEEELSGQNDWACLVTFLNQSGAETANWAGRVKFSVSNDVAICRLAKDEIRADFSGLSAK